MIAQDMVFAKIINVFVLTDISEKIAHFTNAQIIVLNMALVIARPENALVMRDFLE
jgi:hypothetical protein